jgi:23S rRNA pseudouridine2605 synthase
MTSSDSSKSRSTSTKTKVSEKDHVRLNVLLQERGVASRRKADVLIEQGQVQVDGKVVRQLGIRVSPNAVIAVGGKKLDAKQTKKMVYLFHKPDKCITSRSDPAGRKTIFDFASTKALLGNVQSVGRLDFRSEGLLLLTNDGDLAYALTHPKFSVEKKYAVLAKTLVTIEDVERLRAGVKLEDGFAKPLSVRAGHKESLGVSQGQWVEIVVTEGRNRLIRRMLEHIGLQVHRLVRIGIGELSLTPQLAAGEVLAATAVQIKYLERIKKDMLTDRSSTKSENYLTPEDKLKRRIKRKLSLNDDEYLEERDRRQAAAASTRRDRKKKLGAKQTAAPKQEKAVSSSASSARSKTSAESKDTIKPTSRIQPRKVQKAPEKTFEKKSEKKSEKTSGKAPQKSSEKNRTRK